jgi:hypothetical protein
MSQPPVPLERELSALQLQAENREHLENYVRVYSDMFPSLANDRPKEILNRVQDRAKYNANAGASNPRGSKRLSSAQASQPSRLSDLPASPACRVSQDIFRRRETMKSAPLVVIHWEGALAEIGRMHLWNDAPSVYARPGIIDGLLSLGQHFQLALVATSASDQAVRFAKFLAKHQVHIDAMYTRRTARHAGNEFGVLHDYSAIVADFEIPFEQVAERVLIVGPLSLEEAEIRSRRGADVLFHRTSRTSRNRVFTECVGLAGSQAPVVLLVPHPHAQSDFSAIDFRHIVSLIKEIWSGSFLLCWRGREESFLSRRGLAVRKVGFVASPAVLADDALLSVWLSNHYKLPASGTAQQDEDVQFRYWVVTLYHCDEDSDAEDDMKALIQSPSMDPLVGKYAVQEALTPPVQHVVLRR